MYCLGILMRKEQFPDQEKWFLNSSYQKKFSSLHCALFPISSYEAMQASLAVVQGYILPGGYDIHGFYEQVEWQQQDTYYANDMDHFELQCIDMMVKARKPIFGICRGIQLLNVYFKGTLHHDIDIEKHAVEHVHHLFIQENSILRRVYPKQISVNSYHHQAIAKLGKGLQCTALSEDHYVEAILHDDLPIMAVQWHPELMEDDQTIPFFLHHFIP